MENIKITGLCQDCLNWAKCCASRKNHAEEYHIYIKSGAGLEKLIEFMKISDGKDHNEVKAIVLLFERLKVLESDKSEFESHVNFVDEQLIKRVEKLEENLGALDETFKEFNDKVLLDHQKQSPQGKNPLTYDEIQMIRNWNFMIGGIDTDKCKILLNKLQSYLESK